MGNYDRTIRPVKPKVFTVWPFVEKDCQHLEWTTECGSGETKEGFLLQPARDDDGLGQCPAEVTRGAGRTGAVF